MRTQNEIVKELRTKYNQFAQWWEGDKDYVAIIEEVYYMLLELKEIDPIYAHKEAQWLIEVARTWDITEAKVDAYTKWVELLPFFEKI